MTIRVRNSDDEEYTADKFCKQFGYNSNIFRIYQEELYLYDLKTFKEHTIDFLTSGYRALSPEKWVEVVEEAKLTSEEKESIYLRTKDLAYEHGYNYFAAFVLLRL